MGIKVQSAQDLEVQLFKILPNIKVWISNIDIHNMGVQSF